MKNLPKRIYLQIDADGERPEDFKDLSGVSWCADKIHDTDIPYVLESEGSEAVELLTEVRQRLLIDLDDNGEPRSSMADLMQMWDKVNKVLLK